MTRATLKEIMDDVKAQLFVEITKMMDENRKETKSLIEETQKETNATIEENIQEMKSMFEYNEKEIKRLDENVKNFHKKEKKNSHGIRN